MLNPLKATLWLLGWSLAGSLSGLLGEGRTLSFPFFVSTEHLEFASSGAAYAAELSDIQARGYLTVAVKDNLAPLGFLDEDGSLQGFEIEIARRLALDLLGDADAVRFVPVTNVDRLSAVIAGEVDMAIAAVTLTEARRRIVHFSDPYYLDGTAFVVPPQVPLPGLSQDLPQLDSQSRAMSRPVERLEDLRSQAIAVLDRSSTVAHVRYQLPGAQLVGVTSYAEGQALLAQGAVAAFAGDASVLTGWVRPEGALAGYQLLPNVISVEPLAIALPKGRQHSALQAAVNRSIRQWYKEDWLQNEAATWGLPSGVLPSANPSAQP